MKTAIMITIFFQGAAIILAIKAIAIAVETKCTDPLAIVYAALGTVVSIVGTFISNFIFTKI